MSEEEKTALAEPIKHDGWLSRTYVSGMVAFFAVLALLTVLIWKTEKIDGDQYLYGVAGLGVFLLITLGLVKADKLLELAKLWLVNRKKG